MNRRIIIVDDDPDLGINFAQFFGMGLGNEVYKVSDLVGSKKLKLPGMSADERFQIFGDLGPGDGVLLVGPGAFPVLQEWFHFGIRGENYYDCSRLKRLGTSGGFFVKTVYHETDLPLSQELVNFFMSPEFCVVRDLGEGGIHKIVHTPEEAREFLLYFKNTILPGTILGFDYEGSGMAMDREYYITGAAISIPEARSTVFFSFTDIEENSSPEQFQQFLEDFKEVLILHEKSLWVYNAGYEAQVTWRTFGVELDFPDASVFNYIQGLNSKRYSLKWSIQRILGGGTEKAVYLGEQDRGGVLPWDTEFDDLETTLGNMFYETILGKTKKDTIRRLKCSIDTYMSTPEWAEIVSRYPDFIDDFRHLIENPRNFGNPFMCIPSEILGEYCCRDAYYTGLVPLELAGKYSDLCVSTYQGNLSLGHKLMRGGLYIDDEFRLRYDKYCDQMMLSGILFCAQYMTSIKMEKHKKKANKLSSYPPLCQTLINRGEFYLGDIKEITKTILSKNTSDATETGLDDGRLLLNYGQDFAEWLIDLAKTKMAEIKFKGKIDQTIVRKKKLLGLIAPEIGVKIGLDQVKLGTKHEELEKFLYYQKGMKVLGYIASQIQDINNMPETIRITPSGPESSLAEVAEWIMNNYYRCSSPIDNDALVQEMYKRFTLETVFLASIGKEMNKLTGEKKFYANLGITDPANAFLHWSQEYNIFACKMNGTAEVPVGYQFQYPGDLWFTAQEYLKQGTGNDAVKDIWGAWKGYDIQDDYFEVSGNWQEMHTPFTPQFLNEDSFKQMRIFLINLLLYKKYSKIKKTYINGLFCDNSKYVIDTPALMPLRDADPSEPGAVKKCFVKAEVLLKETKRWSSPFHVIPSHQDSKACVGTPTFINPQTGKKTATFLSYFDISSAEVRTLGYKSGDANLINLFETGKDVYIHTAVAHLGKEKWDSLSKGEQKKQRKIFKVVFLAVAYRMSARTLGQNLNVPEQEAQGLIDTLFNEFPTLKGFIEAQCGYPETHDGLVNTFLGDHLQCTDWRYRWKLDKNGHKVIDHMKIAKCQRAGINYKIQNYSAVSLANGFNNVQIQAKKKGILAKNIIVVHDSCQNLVSMNEIFDILDFYLTEFMEFCYSLYGIRFMFDLEVGTDYANMLTLSQGEDKNVISLTGNGSTLLEFLRRINEESDLQVECDTPIEQIQPCYITDAYERFISDRQCCMVKDTSKYTIQLRKLN